MVAVHVFVGGWWSGQALMKYNEYVPYSVTFVFLHSKFIRKDHCSIASCFWSLVSARCSNCPNQLFVARVILSRVIVAYI